MSATVSLEPLRIGDAGDIRQSSIAMSDKSSIVATRNEIRRLLDHEGLQCWVAKIGDKLQAVAKIQIMDPFARRADLQIQSNENGLLPGVLQALIQKAFLGTQSLSP